VAFAEARPPSRVVAFLARFERESEQVIGAIRKQLEFYPPRYLCLLSFGKRLPWQAGWRTRETAVRPSRTEGAITMTFGKYLFIISLFFFFQDHLRGKDPSDLCCTPSGSTG
jgi:hypothetical protein